MLKVDVAARLWERVSTTAPPLPLAQLLGAAAVAAVLVLSPALWRTTRHAVTIAHEGAHGVAALASGRRLAGIRLHSDTSGLTVSAGRPTGPGHGADLRGRLHRPGAGRAWARPRCSPPGTRSGCSGRCCVLLALLLVQIRNWYGLWSVLVTGAVVLAATAWLPPHGQAAFAAVGTWFLLLAAPARWWSCSATPPAPRRAGLRRRPARPAHPAAGAAVGRRLPRWSTSAPSPSAAGGW